MVAPGQTVARYTVVSAGPCRYKCPSMSLHELDDRLNWLLLARSFVRDTSSDT